MSYPFRRKTLFALVRLGLLPADTVLMYDGSAFAWNSGFGEFSHVLYSLILSSKPQTVVEIGSAYGYSTCYAAAALQRNGKGLLHSIDPHVSTDWNDGSKNEDTYAIVKKRLATLNLSKYVIQMREYSHDSAKSWDKEIDIMLIDGSHTYEDVKNDFFGFVPFIKKDGLILFHDTMWEYHRGNDWYRKDQGVPKLIQELQSLGYPMITLKEGWGLTIVQNCIGGFNFIPG